MWYVVIGVLVLAMGVWPAGAAENRWTDVNVEPYEGSPELAVSHLVRYGLPPAVAPDLLEAIKKKAFQKGVIAKGEKCLAMVYGGKTGKVMTDVVMDWKHFSALETEDYAAGEFLVRRATVCNNWLLCPKKEDPKRTEAAPPPLAPPPAPAAAAPPTPPKEEAVVLVGAVPQDHTIRIRVWQAEGLAKSAAAEPGLQSRDLGRRFREAVRKGELKPHTPCEIFKVEFRDVAYERARGTAVYLNGQPGKIPDEFGPQANAFDVPVCNGEGTLTIQTGWLHGDTVLVIHSPWRKPDLHYPPSGRLVTCTAEAIAGGRCGSLSGPGFGEFLRLVQQYGSSNYHFVFVK